VNATQTIISLEKQEEIHCSANGSLGAVRDWQQFGAKRLTMYPPQGAHTPVKESASLLAASGQEARLDGKASRGELPKTSLSMTSQSC